MLNVASESEWRLQTMNTDHIFQHLSESCTANTNYKVLKIWWGTKGHYLFILLWELQESYKHIKLIKKLVDLKSKNKPWFIVFVCKDEWNQSHFMV